jgi:uncharacterized protein (DUF433 family)
MSKLISKSPDVLGGTPVFRGTRVPVRTLFEYLEDNFSIEEFVELFPAVSIDHVRALLEESEIALLGRRTA